MLTCGMMFFSTASWNKGGGGKSTAKKRKGDTVDLISIVCIVNSAECIIHSHDTPRSMSKRGFSLPPVSGRTRTCCVSIRTSPWKVEKMTPNIYLISFKLLENICDALEFFFLLPPRSLCKRLRSHPRNSTGSPCLSKLNFPALARPTSWRNS